MKKHTVNDCNIIKLPKHKNRAGNISVYENNLDLPFDVKRVFYIYDIPGGADRGAHAHKECHQFLVAASGSFEVELDDGYNKSRIQLKHPDVGLHIPSGIWAAEVNFSSGAICLVLTSHKYEESDYIRDYTNFIKNVLNEN
ncbi:MAG: FdtA/QdtA family cupin domain-containing protein [Bacteroidales bacterium]|nr:FdtA/QdtA family cupin domain-containing protein [Bacteroidales bacterium]